MKTHSTFVTHEVVFILDCRENIFFFADLHLLTCNNSVMIVVSDSNITICVLYLDRKFIFISVAFVIKGQTFLLF